MTVPTSFASEPPVILPAMPPGAADQQNPPVIVQKDNEAETDSEAPDGVNVSPAETSGAIQAPSQTTAWVAHLLRRRSESDRIEGLSFQDARLPVVLVSQGKDLRPTIAIRGRFLHSGWTLALDDAPVAMTSDGKTFVIYAHLRSRISEVVLTAHGSDHQNVVEHVYLYAPAAMQFHVVSVWDQVLVSAGLSFMSYSQTYFGNYQSINGLISARYHTPEEASRWGLLANADMTLLTVISSPIANGPQVLEGKLDATYMLQADRTQQWKTQLLGGLTYLTMFSYGSPFGFSNLTAGEIGVRSRYRVSPLAAWVGEARFFPLGDMTAFGQYGFNLSIAWSKSISGTRRAELGLNYLQYVFQPTADQNIRLSELFLKLGLSI